MLNSHIFVSFTVSGLKSLASHKLTYCITVGNPLRENAIKLEKYKNKIKNANR